MQERLKNVDLRSPYYALAAADLKLLDQAYCDTDDELENTKVFLADEKTKSSGLAVALTLATAEASSAIAHANSLEAQVAALEAQVADLEAQLNGGQPVIAPGSPASIQ